MKQRKKANKDNKDNDDIIIQMLPATLSKSVNDDDTVIAQKHAKGDETAEKNSPASKLRETLENKGYIEIKPIVKERNGKVELVYKNEGKSILNIKRDNEGKITDLKIPTKHKGSMIITINAKDDKGKIIKDKSLSIEVKDGKFVDTRPPLKDMNEKNRNQFKIADKILDKIKTEIEEPDKEIGKKLKLQEPSIALKQVTQVPKNLTKTKNDEVPKEKVPVEPQQTKKGASKKKNEKASNKTVKGADNQSSVLPTPKIKNEKVVLATNRTSASAIKDVDKQSSVLSTPKIKKNKKVVLATNRTSASAIKDADKPSSVLSTPKIEKKEEEKKATVSTTISQTANSLKIPRLINQQTRKLAPTIEELGTAPPLKPPPVLPSVSSKPSFDSKEPPSAPPKENSSLAPTTALGADSSKNLRDNKEPMLGPPPAPPKDIGLGPTSSSPTGLAATFLGGVSSGASDKASSLDHLPKEPTAAALFANARSALERRQPAGPTIHDRPSPSPTPQREPQTSIGGQAK